MPGIVEFPFVVEKALKTFGPFFANDPERRHFAEYLTGLYVAARKNVVGINTEFAESTDQSCLNRWITEVPWDVQQLNAARLQELQQDPSSRYSARGVIALDNVLISHQGQLIEDAGYFWDHAEQRYLIAHDYLIINYVTTDGTHYPLEFRRFRKKDSVAKADFKDHTVLSMELIDWVIAHHIPGDFTFDSYFTHVDFLNHIDAQERSYVGDLKFNRKILFQGHEIVASEVAARIAPESRKPIDWAGKRQWYFTRTIRIPRLKHPVRLLILWDRKNGKDAVKMLITNRLFWEVNRMRGVYRKRWTGTDPFHRDGKQHLGMGECQLRSGQGQTRHMYLVFLAYSLLLAEMRRTRVSEWAQQTVTTVGEACRMMFRETLGSTITWAIERALVDQWTPRQIKTYLALV